MIITYKIVGEKANGFGNFNQTDKNGKVCASKNDFNLNWILKSNENNENEWEVFNIRIDHFTKV
jgi:hypothetical protein